MDDAHAFDCGFGRFIQTGNARSRSSASDTS
jgi:hypothetical protein